MYKRQQQEREEEVAGPPVRVAFAADGKPTKALEGFARTNGVSVDDVYRITTEKGEYVAVRKRIGKVIRKGHQAVTGTHNPQLRQRCRHMRGRKQPRLTRAGPQSPGLF